MHARCSTASSSRITSDACAASRAGCATRGPTTVSRQEISRRALCQAATADETEHVLQRLHYLGYVQPDLAYRDKPGRPSTHWLVNPALAETENR